MEPFLLLVVDHDNRRFTIEGPMTDPDAWIHEVIAARRAGRQITCHALPGEPQEIEQVFSSIEGGVRWPPGMIVVPPAMKDPAAELHAPGDPRAKAEGDEA